MSLSVSCGTPAQPVTPPRDVPRAADAGMPADAPRPPDAMLVDEKPKPTAKGRISGRVFRKTAGGETYSSVVLQLVNPQDPSYSQAVMSDRSKRGAYELKEVPPGTYQLYLSDNDNDIDMVRVVTVADKPITLDFDLSRTAIRNRTDKPYGAPSARRRVV